VGSGCDWLIGVDEVGRGCLAGEVMAAAVAIPVDFLYSEVCARLDPQVRDSKKIGAAQRQYIATTVTEWSGQGWIYSAFARSDVGEIERLNILGATQFAMYRALEQLWFAGVPNVQNSARLLIDGRPMKNIPWRHEGVIKGDGISFTIALAANLAKVARDEQMARLSEVYPVYHWQ